MGIKFTLRDLFNKLLFYISPHFSIRYIINSDVRYIVNRFRLKGKVLDVGCGSKPYKKHFEGSSYIGIDFPNFSKYSGSIRGEIPDVYFSRDYKKTGKLPFKNNEYDIVCSFQVLEHTFNYDHMFREMIRTLKNGGYMLLTVPFIWGLHEEPGDFFRYTHYAIKSFAEKYNTKVIYFKKQGGVLCVFENLLTNILTDLNKSSKLYYLLTIPLYLPVLILSYISVLIELISPPKSVFNNYIFLIKKI